MRLRLRRTGGLDCAHVNVHALVLGLVVLVLAVAPSLGAQETRTVSGVVVDAQSSAPVSDAVVAVRGTGLSVLTDREGRFEVPGVPVGTLELVLRHVAYGEHAQPLVVESMGPLHFRIRVSSRAIELAPLEVEVISPEARTRRASGTANNVIDRATIEAFAPAGDGLLPLLQNRIPSLRVQGDCVEYRFLQYGVTQDPRNPELVTSLPCRDVTVYVDGIPDLQGSARLEQLSLRDIERIEVLSSAEAGLQYGAGGRGVILVETRRGVVADTPDRVHINGFGWNEPRSYPWLKVLGVSTLGNAAVAGLTSRLVFNCGEPEVRMTSPFRCNTQAGVVGGALTSAIGRVITHRAGTTSYTEGRTYPALLLSAATASVGYMLYVRGENQDSDGSRLAGQLVLAIGVPIALTLSDRVFRMVR